MAEKAADLRVRNVTLHQRGKKETGTLTLSRHHVQFTFTPKPSHSSRTVLEGGQPENRTSTSAQGSAPSDATPSRDSNVQLSRASEDASHAGPAKQRPIRPKTVWVAMSMITRCVLRPSHSQSSAHRLHMAASEPSGSDDADDGFPPSFGTGSYGRPSTDSANMAPYTSPRRSHSPVPPPTEDKVIEGSGRSPAIRLRCRDFNMMAFHFNAPSEGKSPDDVAREVFFTLRSRACVENIEDMHAFHFQPPAEETAVRAVAYNARKEFARMGIGGKAIEGPGSAWRITDINQDYKYSPTYPNTLCVPQTVSDNMLKYGGAFRSKSRIPALTYLHFNGGSITRSSQPMVGVQGKRNPQDERLVSAIFSSHTPPTATPADTPPRPSSPSSPPTASVETDMQDPAATRVPLEAPSLPLSQSDTAVNEKAAEKAIKRRVYGSTRLNYIVDARPKINVHANRVGGGGIEDISNYMSSGDTPIERVFLNIHNIHVMRQSLDKVIESFGNADYVDLPPDQELLRKSGWLGHIAGLLEGGELVARAVGLTGSHALVHCSDGWDRTAQVAALAQVMLDPHYRTLDGFITLVQKDFVSFGHKFRDRNGILGSEKWFEIENERIAPSRSRENGGSESNSLNVLGSKAFAGAKSWFDKNRGTLFRQQNNSHDSLADSSSRPASPPPNPLLHSPPTAGRNEEYDYKTDEKEIAPIFHQFLDAVYQMQRNYPDAFEFNERFLLRLLYQVYSSQYGEFLFNNERERSAHCHKERPHSVWLYFLARRAEFTNANYDPASNESLLLPKRGIDQQIDVRWWSKLFSREDKIMNLPRALASADPPSMIAQPSSVSLDDRIVSGGEGTTGEATLRVAKSTPSLSNTLHQDSISSGIAALSLQGGSTQAASQTVTATQQPPIAAQETETDVPSKLSGTSTPTAATASRDQSAETEQGDPLGVMQKSRGADKESNAAPASSLDFAAFASASAFRDR